MNERLEKAKACMDEAEATKDYSLAQQKILMALGHGLIGLMEGIEVLAVNERTAKAKKKPKKKVTKIQAQKAERADTLDKAKAAQAKSGPKRKK